VTEQEHREHARKRARERLGIKLTRNRLAAVRADILGGRATRIERATHLYFGDRAMYLVSICGRPARVVFCHQTKQVVTVMRRGVTL
jgi:hypothetical protein